MDWISKTWDEFSSMLLDEGAATSASSASGGASSDSTTSAKRKRSRTNSYNRSKRVHDTGAGPVNESDARMFKDAEDSAEQERQDRRTELGITPALLEYVSVLCDHPSTWLQFPLDELVPVVHHDDGSMEPRGVSVTPGGPGDVPEGSSGKLLDDTPIAPPSPARFEIVDSDDDEHHVPSAGGGNDVPTVEERDAGQTTQHDSESAVDVVDEEEHTKDSAGDAGDEGASAAEEAREEGATEAGEGHDVASGAGDGDARSAADDDKEAIAGRREEIAKRVAAEMSNAGKFTHVSQDVPAVGEDRPTASITGLMVQERRLREPEELGEAGRSAHQTTQNAEVVSHIDFSLTEKQQAHAMMMLEEVDELRRLRYELCPLQISEEMFWQVYFALVAKKLSVSLTNDFLVDVYDERHVSPYCLSNSSHVVVPAHVVNFLDISVAGVDWWSANEHGFADPTSLMKHIPQPVRDREATLRANWENLDIQRVIEERPNAFRALLRHGVPPEFRPVAWKASTGSEIVLNSFDDASFYGEALREVFGADQVPARCDPIPTFGGDVIFHRKHHLTRGGRSAARRLLIMTAMRNPYVDYCPQVPDLLAILLTCLPEYEVFIVMNQIIEQSEASCRYLCLSNRSLELFGRSFETLLEDRLPTLYAYLKSVEYDVSALGVRWFSRLFVGSLPYCAVLRIMDSFFFEGHVSLFRVALAIMSLGAEAICQGSTAEEIDETIGALMQQHTDPEYLVRVGVDGFDVDPLDLAKVFASHTAAVKKIPYRMMTVMNLPSVSSQSSILGTHHFESLWTWLEPRWRIKSPSLIFTTEDDGCNINTLMNKAEGRAPLLLILKCKTDEVMGAFVSSDLHRSPKFYGNAESFVFTIKPEERVYRWERGNSYFIQHVDENGLTIGGGEGTALWIDSELWNGRSTSCTTFNNKPLHSTTEFQCTVLEAYVFVEQ